jgi:hypothetical protein
MEFLHRFDPSQDCWDRFLLDRALPWRYGFGLAAAKMNGSRSALWLFGGLSGDFDYIFSC